MNTRYSHIQRPTMSLIDQIYDSEARDELAILDLSNTDVLTDDFEQDRHITYHLKAPTYKWLADRLCFAPGTEQCKADYEQKILSLLLSIDQNMLITLQYIFFVTKEDDIYDVCQKVEADSSEFPETIDFDENDQLGCFWSQYSSIIINLTAIEKAVQEIADENEYQKEFEIGLLTTLTHEIRHLGLSNMFLYIGDYPPEEAEEEAVERWGLTAYENWKANYKGDK